MTHEALTWAGYAYEVVITVLLFYYVWKMLASKTEIEQVKHGLSALFFFVVLLHWYS